MSPTQKKIENFFVGFGIFVFALILMTLVIEVGFRTFHEEKPSVNSDQFNDDLYVPRPYVMGVTSTKIEGINSLGYKGELPKVPKPKGEIRIAVMGGSNAFGQTPDNDISVPFALEKELQQRLGSHIRVYNFGTPSSVARQNLNRLVLDILPTEPDIVVSYSGGNDLASHEPRVGYPHRFMYYEANPLWSFEIKDYPLMEMLMMGSLAARYFFKDQLEDFFLDRVYKPGFFAPSMEMAWTRERDINYANALIHMDIISQHFGARYIAFFEPMRNARLEETRSHHQMWLQTVTQYFQSLSPDLKFVSLYDLYANEPDSVWRDHIHLHPEDEGLVVKAIAENLMKHFPDVLKKTRGNRQ